MREQLHTPVRGAQGPLRTRLNRLTTRISEAFDRLPIRVRLAAASAALTLVILCMFAVVVGSLTVHRLRSDFDHQVESTANVLPTHLEIKIARGPFGRERLQGVSPSLPTLATILGGHPVIRLLYVSGAELEKTPSTGFPRLGPPSEQLQTRDGYRVVSHRAPVVEKESNQPIGSIWVQYGQPVASLDSTIARIELLLFLGVLGGAALSLLVGVMIARRAMAPIAQLTSTAAEIERTRDPSLKIPESSAQDEVSELARTLGGMLHSLDTARGETEAMLARQRQFVADASHELRTPLTSILANLELLADSLHGEQGEAASSALRSSQRMRRLVADLLLLARSDVGRVVPREPLDLGQVAVEAAAEVGHMSEGHEILLDVSPVPVEAARDELHRLILNLLENALRHTPPGTEIDVRTEITPQGRARLIVQDDGPGVPEELRDSLFERFVRGAGDRGGSFGLGLAIVRAVAESHGGSVHVEDTHPLGGEHRGARFVVTLPAVPADRAAEAAAGASTAR